MDLVSNCNSFQCLFSCFQECRDERRTVEDFMHQQFKIFRQNFGYNQIPFSPFPFPDLAKLVFILLRDIPHYPQTFHRVSQVWYIKKRFILIPPPHPHFSLSEKVFGERV